jgi:hypothetical protein
MSDIRCSDAQEEKVLRLNPQNNTINLAIQQYRWQHLGFNALLRNGEYVILHTPNI